MDGVQDKKLFGIIPIMNPNPTRTVPIVVSCVVICFVIAIVAFVKFFIESNRPRIDLLYTPLSAVATVDGKVVKSGEILLSAGTHEVKVEKYGFESETRMVEVGNGGATSVHIILEPNMEETKDWYSTHEDDGRVIEGVVGHQYEDESQYMLDQYPILTKLPIKTKSFEIYQQGCDEVTVCILVVSDRKNHLVNKNLNLVVDKYRNFLYNTS